MRTFFQFMLLLLISFLGELLNYLLPLPIPGSIYGLVLMLVGLCTKLIPLETVQVPARFLISVMPVMFIPAAAGLVESWSVVQGMAIPAAVIMVVTTFVVMGVTGAVTQALLRRERAREEAKQK